MSEYIQPKQERSRSQKFQTSYTSATLTGRRGGHTPFVQTAAETPDTGAEAVKSNPGSSWEGHSGRRYGRWQNRINAQLALRHILMSGLKMRIFPAQKKKKLDLATENILHNISEQTIFLTVILIGSLHMPS